MTIKYHKMNSNGNDFLITEDEKILSCDIKKLSSRVDGIGFDQLLLFNKKLDPATAKIFNSDGSSAKTCFNGLRCIAGLYQLKNQNISTIGGTISVGIMFKEAYIQTFMPDVEICEKFALVDVGNNHVVMEAKDIHKINLKEIYEEFLTIKEIPSDFNFNLYEIIDGVVHIRTYEHGAGETKSCGSGTVATFAAINKIHDFISAKFSSYGGKTKIKLEDNIITSIAPYELEHHGLIDE